MPLKENGGQEQQQKSSFPALMELKIQGDSEINQIITHVNIKSPL